MVSTIEMLVGLLTFWFLPTHAMPIGTGPIGAGPLGTGPTGTAQTTSGEARAAKHTPNSSQIEVVRQMSYRNGDLSIPLRRFSPPSGRIDREPLFFQSKMSCDVDGAPNAYHPDDDGLALDNITSAEGIREGGLSSGPLAILPSPEIVAYAQGKPFIQPSGDYRGFFVSRTSLENEALPETDPARYLDARKIQYIVLPANLVPEAEVGDLAVAYDPVTKNVAYAVFGDIGPVNESGEASIATVHRLGLACLDGKACPCEDRHDVLFVVFPGTADRLRNAEKWPYLQRTIDRLSAEEFRKWGGLPAAAAATG